MATAGVFRLMVNDGKADKMIMATDMLDCRIKEITALRMAEGYTDGEELPTLLDIEQTHILFVNAHFRPFAAVAYEYARVRVQSGTPQFGGSVTFSIPQQGDFFHDMVINVTLSAATVTPSTATAFTCPANRSNVMVDAAGNINGTGAVNLYSTAVVRHDVVDLSLTNVLALAGATATAQGGALHYADLPGGRLVKNVFFTVNGNPLDNYPSDSYVYFDKFMVSANKRAGWNRCMGQENPMNGWSRHNRFASAADTNQEVSRRSVQVLRGAQTPKLTQPALEMWIPLLFWYTRDPRLSIASVSIPHGQRFITVDIQDIAKVLYMRPSMKLRSQVTVFTYAHASTAIDAASPDNAVGGSWTPNTSEPGDAAGLTTDIQQYTLFHDVGGSETLSNVSLGTSANLGTMPTPTFSTFDLYINNIYLNPNVHDIYIERIGFSLIRIHRNQTVNLCVNESEVLLSAFKFPIEYFFVGLRPSLNLSDVTRSDTDWKSFMWKTEQKQDLLCSTPMVYNSDPATVTSLHGGFLNRTGSTNGVADQITYRTPQKTIDTLSVTAHGISMYNQYNATFFENYLPWQYGGDNLVTPAEEGTLLVNFCFYPGTYQPSGHINVSRSREFHVSYTSSVVGSTVTSADLVAQGSAINFLLISDGSAVLRYST
jgi:hypothetical protein